MHHTPDARDRSAVPLISGRTRRAGLAATRHGWRTECACFGVAPAGPDRPTLFYLDTTANHGCGVGLDVLASALETVVPSLPALTWSSLAVLAAALGLYILYLLAMASFLAICGVPRKEIAKWALKQADRQRLTDLVRVARGVLPSGQQSAPDRTLPPAS